MASDFGIKVSQPGYDARTAADENLLFSSSWPLWNIHKEGAFDVAPGASDPPTTIVEHELDYYPAFLIFHDNSVEGESVLHYSDRTILSVSVDDKRLKVSGPSPVAGSFKGYYYIFQTDLEKDFEAPTIKTGGVASGESNSYGFKATNGDIESRNAADHNLDSSTRGLMLHKVKHDFMDNKSGLIYSKRVFHSLPYKPAFVAYFKSDQGYTMNAGSDVLGYTIQTAQQYIEPRSLLAIAEFSLVVFKDPIENTEVETIAL